MAEPARVPDDADRSGGEARVPMSWDMYDSLEYDDELRGAEYMDGELLLPPGLPDWDHQKGIRYLEHQLEQTLGEGEDVISGFGWKPAGVAEEYGPDVMVCTVPTDRRRFTGIPLLVAEVTSSNWQNDVVRKRAKYAAAGLPDYWIVDRRSPALRCHELRHGVLVETEVYQPEMSPDELVVVSYAGRSVELELTRLFP